MIPEKQENPDTYSDSALMEFFRYILILVVGFGSAAAGYGIVFVIAFVFERAAR